MLLIDLFFGYHMGFSALKIAYILVQVLIYATCLPVADSLNHRVKDIN